MRRVAGFTLIELMIVLAIIVILAMVALPSYREHVLKSNRTLAEGVLLEVAGRQEQFFVNNNQYATLLTQLGYSAATVGLNQERETGAAGSGIYNISFSSASTTAFTAQALPTGGQTDDAKCATLSLTNLGVKGATGTGSTADCW